MPRSATTVAAAKKTSRRPAGAATAGAAAACSSAGRWIIDARRSTLAVSVKVGPFAAVHGTFSDVTGHIDLAADPSRSRVEVVVATVSLSSGSACMDSLLHGAGVIDSRRNPSIGFVSRAIRSVGEPGSWFLDGLLATDGAVLDVTLQMSDPVAQDGALLFRATGSLPSKEAVRLLSQPGVERVLGRAMGLDLAVVAVPSG